jgi:hypothetical protein
MGVVKQMGKIRNIILRLLYSVFVALAITSQAFADGKKDAAYYFENIDEATALIKGRCKSYADGIEGTNNILGKDAECLVVRDVIIKSNDLREQSILTESLHKFEQKLVPSVKMDTPEETLRYRSFAENFEKDQASIGDFLASCIEDKERIKNSAIECLAAVRTMIKSIEKEKTDTMPDFSRADEYREYYRKYFKDHDDIEDRCKTLFANPWYESDPSIQDLKCNISLLEKKRKQRQLKVTEHNDEEKVETKDIQYFRKNIAEAKGISNDCINGTINNITYCNFSLQVVMDNEKEQAEISKFMDYYSGHFLAAKYRLKWCKSSMLDFNSECNIVSDILKNHKDKELDDKKYNLFYAFFKEKPIEAKNILEGECKAKLDDPWYFLDINIQTEKCNAAVDAMNDY